MLLIRVARMTTIWTKAKYREPIFRAGDRTRVTVRSAGGMRLHRFQIQPRTMVLWWRDGRGFFYGAPRSAEYRLARLRPGDVTRVLHNAKNDFAAASGRERTYRWSDFLFEVLGPVAEIRFAGQAFLREDLL